MDWVFLTELAINGALTGLLYSLFAIGLVLIYKASSVPNLAQGGLTSKLLIPNSQILYTRVSAPGPDEDSRRAQIRTALEGRTPYDVDDLVFDFVDTGELPTQ